MSDLVVSEGYADAGYEYINVDDCWLEKTRGSRGELVADQKRFPRGMKSLGEYVSTNGRLPLRFVLIFSRPLDPLERPEVRHLPRLRQLHLRWVPGDRRLRTARRAAVRRLGSRLREARRLLLAATRHGHWLSGLRKAFEQHWAADDLLVQLAGLPNLRRHQRNYSNCASVRIETCFDRRLFITAELLIDHTALQFVAQLRRYSGFVGITREHHRLLRKQPGRDCAERWPRTLE